MSNIKPIKIKGRILKPPKAIVQPLLGSRNVLTDTPWDFVDLWLRKKKKENALFYWTQAREFHNASLGLPIQSSPLLHYYSFMNAVKALLSMKGETFNEYHGVQSHDMRGPSSKISITNEGVKIKENGVLPSLSKYFNENETSKIHSLQDLLFNLPYIHRTYCLTYKRQTEMYIPLTNCMYVADTRMKKAYFRANLSVNFLSSQTIKRLPTTFILEQSEINKYTIRSIDSTLVSKLINPSSSDISNLVALNRKLREDLCYINGAQTLWYIKANTSGPYKISRFPLTITLAAMHRISELCRYKPLQLSSFLSGHQNWLLSEFIQRSSVQFFDEIASEITGYQFLIPNVRPAS